MKFVSLDHFASLIHGLTEQSIFVLLRAHLQRTQCTKGTLQILVELAAIGLKRDLGHSITFLGPLEQRRRIEGPVAVVQRQRTANHEHDARAGATARQRRLNDDIPAHGEGAGRW